MGDDRRGRSGRRKWGLLVASVLISVAICEAVLRLAWTNPFRDESPDQILRLALHHPRRELLFDRSDIDPETPVLRIRTDERSYILPSRRFQEPEATIAFLGGSTTECFAVREELRFPALVSTLLEKRGRRVNTLNAGKSDSTAHDSLNVLLNHVVQDRPDVVVMMHATNDIGVLSRFKSYRPRMGEPMGFGTVGRWALQEASAVSSLAGVLRKAFTVKPLRTRDLESWLERRSRQEPVSSDEFAPRLHAFVAVSRAFGIEPVLMTQPLLEVRTRFTPEWADPTNQRVFNQTIRSVAEREKVTLIDLERHILESGEVSNDALKVFYDGMHVTDFGSRIYAEYITERLLESVLQ